jgi:peptide/nickel transport system permease protein
MSDRPRRRRSLAFIVGMLLIVALALVAIVAPVVLSGPASILTADTRADPSWAHWFGTDDLGRDVFARTMVATRLTMLMAAAATSIAIITGVLVGGLVQVAPRRLRDFVLRLIDSTVAFPSLILALVIAAILGPATSSAIIAIGIAGIPGFARITANMTAGVVHRDFVTTARLLGVPAWRLFTRHLLPNVSGPLLALCASSFALALLEISSLSFVGLGVQSPDYDWGRLLNEGLPAIYSQPVQVVAPSVMLIIAGVAAMLTGDGLATGIDPWGRQPKAAKRPARDTVAAPATSEALVEVRNLTVTTASGVRLVHGIDFEIAEGEILGLVGESGSGKSMTAMSLARLQADTVAVDAEVLRVGDLDLRVGGNRGRLAREIGLVYQDPGSTFNPALRLGSQLTEVARVHLRMPRRRADEVLTEALRTMRVTKPEERLRQHSFQLSGGMLQRAIIASSLVTTPRLIIADEPTSALDVTVQAEVLAQLRALNESQKAAILFISHDLGVVAALCHRILVMRQGVIVEHLTAAQLAAGDVTHPYTRALLDATPRLPDGTWSATATEAPA